MAKMKSKNQLAARNVRKMIQEYWETLESEQIQSESASRNQAVRVSRVKINK